MPNFATPKQCRVPVHCWCNILQTLWLISRAECLRTSPRELWSPGAAVCLASHSSVQPPLSQTTSQTASHGTEIQSDCEQRWAATRSQRWYWSVQLAAALQNFLLKTLVTDRQSAQTCHRSRPVSLRADGCGHVSSVKESVRCALGKCKYYL